MARNGVEVFVKRNSKLDAFLKRNLDEDTFERIRAHEACVVCSKRENKAFKFVVLSDDWLYLTENPPKRVSEEVHLGNILSIKLVNDFPEFLSGAERENTQHIVIKHMSRAASKGKPKRHGNKDDGTPRATGAKLTYRGSLTVRSGKHGRWERKTPSLKETMKTMHADMPERRRCSMDADVLRNVLESKRGGESRGSKKKRAQKGMDSEESVVSRGDGDNDSVGSTGSRGEMQTGSGARRLPPRPLPGPRGGAGDNGIKLHATHTGELRLALERLDELRDDQQVDDELATTTSSFNGNRLSKSDSTLTFPKKTEDPDLENENDDWPNGRPRRERRSVTWQTIQEEDETSISELFLPELFLPGQLGLRHAEAGQTEEEGVVDDAWLPEELHLYILSLASPILMFTRAAWNNYLIRETLGQDPEYVERTMATPELKSTASEKFSLLFTQLKTELLQKENTMENIFSLVNELKTAAERNFALKKLFWRTPEMFLFFINQLKTYLPKSPSKMYAESDEGKSQRADELELAVLLLETLALMFRETEILPYRLSCLRSGQGKAVLDLVNLVVAQPQLLDLDPHKLARPSLTGTATFTNDWTPEADVELYTLAGELNLVATTVLSELILIAREANWGNTDGNFLNLCWLAHVLDETASMEAFVEQVVSGALCLITPGRTVEELDPREAVRVFHQFSVLHTIIEYSPATAAFIADNFYEEFKYFVQGPVILKKLPAHYPIADATIKYIEEVMSSVLGKAVSLALNNALT